jgi:hypothetical protein
MGEKFGPELGKHEKKFRIERMKIISNNYSK